jgi:hypothetical protein
MLGGSLLDRDLMDVPVPSDVLQLIGAARERADALICALESLRGEPIEVARERAAATVQQYCTQLLDQLSVSLPSASDEERIAWLKRRYAELAMDFAKSVCQIETDAARRHAVAQAVQQQVLELERRLRSVLEALGAAGEGPASAVVSPAPKVSP